MLGSINNRGKVSEPCLSSPIITLHRGTLSIPPPAPKGGATKRQHSLNGVLLFFSPQKVAVVNLLVLSSHLLYLSALLMSSYIVGNFH